MKHAREKADPFAISRIAGSISSSKGTTVKTWLSVHCGRLVVHVRVCAPSPEAPNGWVPTARGVSLRPADLPKLREALDELIAIIPATDAVREIDDGAFKALFFEATP